MLKGVLFLCTGNYYRSRFAESLFNWLANERGLDWSADSSGLNLCKENVGPISRHTVNALGRLGVPADGEWRSPRSAAESDFAGADLVVAIKEAEHRAMLERSFPNWVSRVEFWHVHDLDCSEPAETIAELERLVIDLVERLASPENAKSQS